MPIIDKTDGKLAEVCAFADTIGLREQLEDRLSYLAGYANGEGCLGPTRCYLFKDFAPQSFAFVMEIKRKEVGDPARNPAAQMGPSKDPEWEYWFNGGLVFHQAGSSGAEYPVLSVRMDSSESGWSVHT